MRLLLLLTMFVACGKVPSNMIPPEQAAREYMRQLGLESQLLGVSCAGTDSDNDGYVTCTVSRKAGTSDSNDVVMDSLQCAAYGSNDLTSHYTLGCKGTLAKAQPPVTVIRQ